jgi:hypothetical protein
MSKNKKPHLTIISEYRENYINKNVYDKNLYNSGTNVIFNKDGTLPDWILENIKNELRVLEDREVVLPWKQVKNIKNLVCEIYRHKLTLTLYTNCILTIYTLNNCILAHKTIKDLGYPPLDTKYVEAYSVKTGEKINIKDSHDGRIYTSIADTSNKLLLDVLEFMTFSTKE